MKYYNCLRILIALIFLITFTTSPVTASSATARASAVVVNDFQRFSLERIESEVDSFSQESGQALIANTVSIDSGTNNDWSIGIGSNGIPFLVLDSNIGAQYSAGELEHLLMSVFNGDGDYSQFNWDILIDHQYFTNEVGSPHEVEMEIIFILH